MPTPVSALIHAATMVTAGVYLLMRSSPLIEYSNTVLLLCLWIGAITTVFSSLIGLFQQDIKKVIAYSTMSQLARKYKNFFIFRHQTICVEFNRKLDNSQITKARDLGHNNINLFNSFTSKWLHFTYKMFEERKVSIVGKLVGISEAIRLILMYFFLAYFLNNVLNNLMVFKNAYSTSNFNSNSNRFNEWLAGLIDGDGYFILTKKGYTSFEITISVRDRKVLVEIQNKYGGSIKTVSGAKAVRYKLRNKKGLLLLVNDINGLIRNPIRLLQFNKVCAKYNTDLIYSKPLTYHNGWLSGFIDSDGSIYLNEASGQVFISITQKNKFLLEPLIDLYGGRIDILSPKIEAFKYVVFRKDQLFILIDNYFSKYPLKTDKHIRMDLIKQFYDLRNYKNKKNEYDLQKFNDWVSFKDKWDKYKD